MTSPASPVDAAAIRAQLERLATSDVFTRSHRLRSLLEFLVRRVLDGADDGVKEYILGIEVYGRGPAYDPRTDPIVRVEMRQLRLKLTTYYSTFGRHDPVLVEIPKGQYRAVITARDHRAADLSLPQPAPDVEGVDEQTSPRAVSDRHPTSRRRRWLTGALVVGAAVVAMAIWWGGVPRRDRDTTAPAAGPAPTPQLPSVAVFPFDTLATDTALAFVGEGLADEIASTLVKLDGLRVTGPASTARLRDAWSRWTTEPLGVDGVIEGSARAERDRVRVVARLTRASDRVQLWSDTFDYPVTSMLDAQTTAARAVADALRLRIDRTAGQPFVTRGNDNVEAHALYLEARQLSTSREENHLERSIELFEQAIARDPGYAMAHAGLADVLATLVYNGQRPPGEGLAQSRAASMRALELDPTLGEAEANLGSLAAFVDWQWSTADEHFRRALALAPSHPRIRAWYGQGLVVQRRFEEALHMLLTAQRLDPLAPAVTYAVGEAYLYWGRYDEALVQARQLFELDPQSRAGRNLRARALLALGRHDEAAEALRTARGELWADVLGLVATGDQEAASALLATRQHELSETQPFTIASLYSTAGDIETAFVWLRRALSHRQVDVLSAMVDPALAPLRADPRFLEIASALDLVDAMKRPGWTAP